MTTSELEPTGIPPLEPASPAPSAPAAPQAELVEPIEQLSEPAATPLEAQPEPPSTSAPGELPDMQTPEPIADEAPVAVDLMAADASLESPPTDAEEASPPTTTRKKKPLKPIEYSEIELPQVGPKGDRFWYVLKVQANREDSVRDAIVKRLKIRGLDAYLGEIVVPTEKVSEIKGGKKRVTERKFYPGYIMIFMEMNDEVWFTIRETAGVGDFVQSGGKPVPMTEQDIARMLGRATAEPDKQPRLKISFQKGDRVKIKEGPFENFEGEVEEVNEAKGVVKVMIQVFGRPAPVELEYWQAERV